MLGLILSAPVMLLIAIAVKLTSKGPVLYTQTRIGLDRRWNQKPKHVDSRMNDLGGRPFTMYKFRTMDHNAEEDGKEVWATQDYKRVTAVGRALRVCRLDELPQLWNVLAGDMNIVGPRPERPKIFAELRVAIPHYHLRQRVRPGITGWAQIHQAYDTCVDDVRRKIEFDLEYVRTRSISRDLAIMARTVPVMVTGKLGW
jgi:lipopolysaccharide/colanic/teichoic acid biosynthesis glycosyltransferase